MEAARVEAHELDAVAWSPVRADEQTLDTWTTDGPIYRDVPRWEVRRDDGQGWDTATDEEPCDGFTGGNAWGACAKCGRRLEDHAA